MDHLTTPTLTDAIPGWVAFIEANAAWAEAILFLVAFAESLAFVGFAVPAAALIAAGGVLVATGALGFWQVCIAVALGAVLGDAASYWIGRLFGDRIPQLWPFRSRPELLARSSRFFERHGGKSVFLARFLGPLRPVVPLTAGMMAMPHRNFQIANLLSAAIWAPLLVMPGLAVSKSVEGQTDGGTRPAQAERAAPCGLAPPIAGEPPPDC